MLAARLALTCALLNFLISTLVFAQMAWQNRNLDVGRVGLRIACKCGCPDTVATCNMLACGFSKPAKEKISAMQQAGASDQTIIDSFTKEYGPDIFRSVWRRLRVCGRTWAGQRPFSTATAHCGLVSTSALSSS